MGLLEGQGSMIMIRGIEGGRIFHDDEDRENLLDWGGKRRGERQLES